MVIERLGVTIETSSSARTRQISAVGEVVFIWSQIHYNVKHRLQGRGVIRQSGSIPLHHHQSDDANS